MNSEQKETPTKSLHNSVFGQDSSGLANAGSNSCCICQNVITKLHKVCKKRKKRKERSPRTIDNISGVEVCHENMTAMQLLKWVEVKVAILKTLVSSAKGRTDDRRKIVDNILEGVKKANRSVITNNEGISYLIKMLEETALSLLGMNKSASNFHGIKNISTLLVHLLATAGTKVTTENVQKYINGCRVIDLYKVFAKQRKPFLKEMDSITRYIAHGLEDVQITKKEYREHLKTIQDIFSKDAASSDLLEMNLKLKAAAADLENFLNRYKNATEFLMRKAKDFHKSKVGVEHLTSKFMTQEIEYLFEAGV